MGIFLIIKIGNSSDEDKFRVIYNDYHQKVYSYSKFITHSEIIAEEITQEVFMKLWEIRHQIDSINNMEGWIAAIVRNKCYTYLKRLANERQVLQYYYDAEEIFTRDTEGALMENELLMRLKKVITNLPQQQQRVYLMSRQEESTYSSVAQKLGVSVNTVKSHMKAALKKIRAEIGGEYKF